MITFSILICSAACTHARINTNYSATFQVHGSEKCQGVSEGERRVFGVGVEGVSVHLRKPLNVNSKFDYSQCQKCCTTDVRMDHPLKNLEAGEDFI